MLFILSPTGLLRELTQFGRNVFDISKVMNTKPDVTFALKAYLKIKPFISLIIGVILIIGVFGVGIKAFENYNENLVNLISLDNNSPGSV